MEILPQPENLWVTGGSGSATNVLHDQLGFALEGQEDVAHATLDEGRGGAAAAGIEDWHVGEGSCDE